MGLGFYTSKCMIVPHNLFNNFLKEVKEDENIKEKNGE